ncbi:MAG: carboxypeptidase-like regulatory domain-containing protein [candidate division KSB1 bacterium]|nr:carboxypeptidase-like regulatory domain-containing protein [candidate division KSB1 bacterium]
MPIPKNFITIVMSLLSVVSCGDVERDNPFDAKSDHYYGQCSLRGKVVSYYAPHTPVTNARVELKPAGRMTYTDEQGVFAIKNIFPDTYTVIVSKSGYKTDSTTVPMLAGEEKIIEDFKLDALPVFSSIKVSSTHINSWTPPEDYYKVNFEAQVRDPDSFADIDSVQVWISALDLTKTLMYNFQTDAFTAMLSEQEIPGGKLEKLIGHSLVFVACDKAGGISVSTPTQLARVIYQTPKLKAPSGWAVLYIPKPEFIWEPFKAPYSYTYALEVYRYDAATPTWSRAGISPADTLAIPEAPLPVGEYSCMLWVVDEFGNASRARPSKFFIIL